MKQEEVKSFKGKKRELTDLRIVKGMTGMRFLRSVRIFRRFISTA